MIINNIKLMSTFISVKQGEINLHCKNVEMKEKIDNLLVICNSNLNKDWNKDDYLNFFRAFSKLDVDVFNDLYPEMKSVLEMTSLADIKNRLVDLDSKLELHVFDDERTFTSVNGHQVLSFKEHEFSTADIVLLFKRLNSKINQHCAGVKDFYKGIAANSESLNDKKKYTKELLDLLMERDTDIISIITSPYYDWINKLSNDDSIYYYLDAKVPHLIQLAQKFLSSELNEFEYQDELFRHKKDRISNLKSAQAKFEQKHKDYRNHSITF